jgi:hypothetical protein
MEKQRTVEMLAKWKADQDKAHADYERMMAKFRTDHCVGPVLSPGLVMWDLWWKKWRWGRFYLST